MRRKILRDQIPSTRELGLAARSAVVALIVGALLFSAQPASAAERGRQLEFGVDMARRGLWAEALFRFQRAALENPNNPRIINNLAVASEAVGDFDGALELYREAVKLDPGNAELKRNYARFVEFYQSFRPRDEAGEQTATEASAPKSQADAPENVENEEGE